MTSKEWNWQKNEKDLWLKPSIESHYYANYWLNLGYKNILDLGCGLGRHSILFAKKGFNVSSCDLSEYAINYLKAWAKKEDLNIETTLCDMLNTPYNDKTFDAIFSYHTVSHTNTLGFNNVLEEIKRILKPGGEIFITLCSKDTWSFKEAGYPKIDENTVIKIDDGPEKDIPHFYVNLDDINRLFKDFDLISVRHIDDIYYTDKVNHSWHYFIHAKLK